MIPHDFRCMTCAAPNVMDLCGDCRNGEEKMFPLITLWSDGGVIACVNEQDLIDNLNAKTATTISRAFVHKGGKGFEGRREVKIEMKLNIEEI